MALTVCDLSKAYGAQIALRDINFTLDDGVVALLGANGSGKSTLLRTLATLTRPDTGEILFEGWSYTQHQRQLRAQIGYLPQDFELPDGLTPRRFLTYLAGLRDGDADAVLSMFDLGGIADQPCHKLSGGQLRLVGVAQALLGAPRLLLLDELTRGLDVSQRERVWRVAGQHSQLTLFSTHVPAEAESIAQWVLVLHQGRLLFCDTLSSLRASAAGQVYEICAAPEAVPQFVETLLISRITPRESQVVLRVIGQTPGVEAVPAAPTLEDAYLRLIQQAR